MVAVTEDQLVLLENGAPQWRKISMDVMICAFREEFYERMKHVDAGLIPANFWKAARHVPINYKFFAPAADFESQIFVASLQILEDLRITADVLAPWAFHLMKLWAQSREMQKQTANFSDDEAGGATILLSKVKYRNFCDHVDKNTNTINKRLVVDGLNCYERAMEAEVSDLLARADTEFGPGSPLTTMSKLVKLSQMVQTASQSRKTSVSVLLRHAVQIAFLRLSLNLIPMTEGITALTKTELPRCILIAELIQEAAGKFARDGEPMHVFRIHCVDRGCYSTKGVCAREACQGRRPSVYSCRTDLDPDPLGRQPRRCLKRDGSSEHED